MPKTVVLVCTCDRPDSLRSLLVRLASQVCEHHASLVITDNGSHSSEEIVKDFVEVCPIVYKRIKEPGLVVARNEALRLALTLAPDYLAFVDDDEVPREGWITNLLKAMDVSGADIVNGPVFPDFVIEPPHWARDGEFFSKSGKILGTSNLLLRATCLPHDEVLWFQPQFNLSGGEDNEFLNRLVRNGAVHAVAEDAVVQEYIPATRLQKQYMWRRGLRDGVVISQIGAITHKTRGGFTAYVLWRSFQKIGYACNHLFWSVGAPWRLASAISDVAAASGILLRAMGKEFRFYGPQQNGR